MGHVTNGMEHPSAFHVESALERPSPALLHLALVLFQKHVGWMLILITLILFHFFGNDMVTTPCSVLYLHPKSLYWFSSSFSLSSECIYHYISVPSAILKILYLIALLTD